MKGFNRSVITSALVLHTMIAPLAMARPRPTDDCASSFDEDPNAGVNSIDKMQNKVAGLMTQFARSHQRYPSIEEIEKEAIGKNIIAEGETLFGITGFFVDMNELIQLAKKKNLGAFSKVIDPELASPERQAKIVELYQTKTRLIVTSIVPQNAIDPDVIASLRSMAKKLDAGVILQVLDGDYGLISDDLRNDPLFHIVVNSIVVPGDHRISSVNLRSKKLRPVSGLQSYGERGTLQIYPSVQIIDEPVATSENETSPHSTIGTGTISSKNFDSKRLVGLEQAAKAAEDHRLAVLILEKSSGAPGASLIQSDTQPKFHHRHAEFVVTEQGEGFSDLGKIYLTNGNVIADPARISMPGDFHGKATDAVAVTAYNSQVAAPWKNDIEIVVAQDPIDTGSLNGHEKKNVITRASRGLNQQLNLKDEITTELVPTLNSLAYRHPKAMILVSAANHTDFIDRHLQSGDWMTDPAQFEFMSKLAQAKLAKRNVLEYALVDYFRDQENPRDRRMPIDPDRFRFLNYGEFYQAEFNGRKYFIQHGDAGANGAKPSPMAHERATDGYMGGHTHTTWRKNETIIVGTMTRLRMGYNNSGYSSWRHSVGLIFQSGSAQILTLRDGEWYRISSRPGSEQPVTPKFEARTANQVGSGEASPDQFH